MKEKSKSNAQNKKADTTKSDIAADNTNIAKQAAASTGDAADGSGLKIIAKIRIKRLLEDLVKESEGKISSTQDISLLNLSSIGADKLSRGFISGLKHIRKIHLDNNNLESLDEAFDPAISTSSSDNKTTPVYQVSYLRCVDNKLKEVDVTLNNLKNSLITLVLSKNKINAFNRVNNASLNLPNLKALILDHNNISGAFEIPSALSNLETIVISNNNITSIDVSSVKNLEKLSASHNRLKDIPDLSMQSNLKELRLAHNKITCEGDDWIARLPTKIEILDVSSNSISDEKDFIKKISKANLSAFLKSLGISNQNDSKSVDLDEVITKYLPKLSLLNFKPFLPNQESKKDDITAKFLAKEIKRKKNLISNKLQKPDATKIRNKPCPCGSGKKNKLCCGDKVKAAIPEETKVIEPPQKKSKQEDKKDKEDASKSSKMDIDKSSTNVSSKKDTRRDSDSDDDDDEIDFSQLKSIASKKSNAASNIQKNGIKVDRSDLKRSRSDSSSS